MRMSLRRQISLWYALAIPLLILGLTFMAQQVMVASLRAGVDERLQQRTEVVARAITSSPSTDPQDYEDLIEWLTEQQLPYVPAILRISDPQRNALATFGDIPDPMVPIMDRQLLLPEVDEGRFETVRIRGHEALRLYTIPVRDSSTLKTVAFIQTGDSLAEVVAAQEQLWRYALIVGVVGSLMALLVGLFIIRRGLRPLDTILNRVQDIQSENLASGLPEEPRPPELQQLADSLNSMLHRLDTAFKTREVFVASVSHDLKTPLTVLQGQIDVLLMEPSMNAVTKRSLDSMAREVRRLVRMANNLLLNAQLESAPVFIPGEVNLRELIDEVVREARVLAEGLDLKVSTPKVVVLPGDYDLLKQMVLNVVDNAIKFTPRGGSIELVLSQEEGYAILKVSDTGQGIPPEHLPHVTEPFYKADASRKSGSGGVGLGLAIVKQIIDLHNGQVEIRSQEGVGTTVITRLPLELVTGSRASLWETQNLGRRVNVTED